MKKILLALALAILGLFLLKDGTWLERTAHTVASVEKALYEPLRGGGAEAVQDTRIGSSQDRLYPQEQELQKTLARIRQNGPYPYSRDGITFENRERLLPFKPRGYYREYTVDTPGLSHRGPRRVVTGGNPPVEFYYTQDHYRSFTRIQGH